MEKRSVKRKRGRWISVYVSADELQILEELRKECGETLHGMVKRLLREKLREIRGSRVR